MASPKQEARVGEVLKGKYRLDALLGVGGMGAVYRATHIQLGRSVAIKLLLDEHSEDEGLAARFFEEARVATLVEHPHVVEILDVDRDERGQPFIVQEYLEGEDLSAHIKEHPDGLPVDVVLALLQPVAEAVGEAHSHQIVHRDLKPDNIFLARERGVVVPKVLDFGISKVPVKEGEARRTATNIIMGSPAYMSPEQVQTPKTVDSRADVWALGIILYEALTGSLPYYAESPGLLFVRICTEDVLPISSLVRGVPPTLEEIIERCLTRDRDERIRDGAALASRLARVMAGDGARISVPAPPPDGHAKTDPRRIGIKATSLQRPKHAEAQRKVPTGATTMPGVDDEARPPTDFGAWTVPDDLVLDMSPGAPSSRPAPRRRSSRAPGWRPAPAPRRPEPEPTPAPLELQSVAPRPVVERKRRSVAASPVQASNIGASSALVVFLAWLSPALTTGRSAALAASLGDFAQLVYLAVALVLLATGFGVLGNSLRLSSMALGLAGAGILSVTAAFILTALATVAAAAPYVQRWSEHVPTLSLVGGAATAFGFGAYALLDMKERWLAKEQGRAAWMLLLALGAMAVGAHLGTRVDVVKQALGEAPALSPLDAPEDAEPDGSRPADDY